MTSLPDNSLDIRQLMAQDGPAMARLHIKGFTPSWPEDDMAAHTQKDIVLGMGEPLLGFVILRAAFDQAEILTLIVDPQARGAGLAKQLMAASEDMAQAQGVDVIFLEVAEDNAAAIALYKSCGYEPMGRRPGYYRREKGRVAALTFRKSL